jgi:hypothetical protein
VMLDSYATAHSLASWFQRIGYSLLLNHTTSSNRATFNHLIIQVEVLISVDTLFPPHLMRLKYFLVAVWAIYFRHLGPAFHFMLSSPLFEVL